MYGCQPYLIATNMLDRFITNVKNKVNTTAVYG